MDRLVYHVDRWDHFEPGQVVELDSLDECVPEAHVPLSDLYPAGLSHHGRYYFSLDLYEEDTDDLWDFVCELIFEAVRLAHFPDRPSRLASVFGFETLPQIAAFIASVVDSSYTVWKVRADSCFEADMELVDAKNFADGVRRAHSYWQGETFLENPSWELLLTPPIEIVEEVTVEVDQY